MKLYFDDFEFDVEKQLLFKGDKLIELKKNQVSLLDFFLSDPDSVHSKDVMLNAIWANQVVSDQVIFQTISQLRSILGHNAIKTFSGRGYKWQLIITSERITSGDYKVGCVEQLDNGKHIKSAPTKRIKYAALAFCMAVISISAAIFYQNDDSITLYISHKETSSVNDLIKYGIATSLEENRNINIQYLNNSPNSYQAIGFRNKHNLPDSSYLLAGNVFSSSSGAILQYTIASKMNIWQGFIEQASVEYLGEELSLRLNQLSSQGILNSMQSNISAAELDRLLNKAPYDPDILQYAAKDYIERNQGDIALVYLNKLTKLETLKKFSLYKAAAYWQIGKIYKMRGQHVPARNSLKLMSEVLKQNPFSELHFQYIKTKAWLEYSETNHEAMFRTLDEGLKYVNSTQAEVPFLKFKLHILYSILAHKVNNHQKKYAHLSLAQTLLLQHSFDKSNLAVIYYHTALFSVTEQSSTNNFTVLNKGSQYVVNLEKILELPRTIDNFWVHDEAIDLLVHYYISQQNFDAARSVLESRAATPKRILLQAQILTAEQKSKAAIRMFELAFEKAKVDYDTRTAVESALHLYRLLSTEPQLQAQYYAYLESNTNKLWLNKNVVATNQ